ncbi:MAG: hypothetical protein AAFY72_03925 [Cyanobacteria bacterium J06649_4]
MPPNQDTEKNKGIQRVLETQEQTAPITAIFLIAVIEIMTILMFSSRRPDIVEVQPIPQHIDQLTPDTEAIQKPETSGSKALKSKSRFSEIFVIPFRNGMAVVLIAMIAKTLISSISLFFEKDDMAN